MGSWILIIMLTGYAIQIPMYDEEACRKASQSNYLTRQHESIGSGNFCLDTHSGQVMNDDKFK